MSNVTSPPLNRGELFLTLGDKSLWAPYQSLNRDTYALRLDQKLILELIQHNLGSVSLMGYL